MALGDLALLAGLLPAMGRRFLGFFAVEFSQWGRLRIKD